MGEEDIRIDTPETPETSNTSTAKDDLEDLFIEFEDNQSKKNSSEYLSRFKKYEDSIIPNERAPMGSRVVESNKKGTKKKSAKALRVLILIISAIAFVCSGTILAKRGIEYIAMKKNDSEINQLTIPESDLQNINSNDTNSMSKLIEKYPQLAGVQFPANFNMRYSLLYAANREFVGYLKINGTSINTAVVQHNDDDYYYDHDFYGNKSVYGAIFALSKNNMQTLDQNTVLIGHHMKDGSRFHDLITYKTMDGYKESPIIEFNTPYADHKWKVYGAFILNGAASGDNGYLLDCQFNNISKDSFSKYITEINKRTLYTTGVDILPTDKILTLITCTYEFTNARLVVIARMVRPGEDESVDLSKVKSKSIKYPQALYDKRKLTNPYINDEKWYPY